MQSLDRREWKVKKEVQIEGKKPKKEEGASPRKGVSCRDQGFDSRGSRNQ